MNAFVSAIQDQTVRTTNGMVARKSTANAVVDLFYNSGASRGKDIIPQFVAALAENRDLALRIAAWLRDVRGGAGERQLFRDILVYLEKNDSVAALALLKKVPELGRWDDIFVFNTDVMKSAAYTMLGNALRERNGLAAKWTPRKGMIAQEIRTFFGMSPKFYRKSLVNLTNVVESQMCDKEWDDINFSHVPSVAASRYKKAFNRNTEKYKEYVASLVKGDNPEVKVNASAIFPYDVLNGVIQKITQYYKQVDFNETELNLIQKQWEALPNYVGDSKVLPLVDSSGSMLTSVAGKNSYKSSLTCLTVALSLGLYMADKNKGVFKDTFLTFSANPNLVTLKGNIIQKIQQMKTGEVANTNLERAIAKILDVAVRNNVPNSDMPDVLMIFSDMQFDQGVSRDQSAMDMIESRYIAAGYTVPKVVYWNLNASYGNAPVKFDKSGTALVSGFSPAIVKPLLSGDMENFTPESIMMKTIMDDRYKVL